VVSDWPFWVVVTGRVRVSAMGDVVGMNWTVRVQVAAGMRVVQFEFVAKFVVDVLGVDMVRVAVPVLVRLTVWVLVVGVNMRKLGVRLRPGSGFPKPVREAMRVPAEVVRVRVPVRAPVTVGLKEIWR